MHRLRNGISALASSVLFLGRPSPSAVPPVYCLRIEVGGELDPEFSESPVICRWTLAIRLPYNSPFLREASPSRVGNCCGGGAPRPKDPRGTGTPPFFSNFAMRSRRAFPVFELALGEDSRPLLLEVGMLMGAGVLVGEGVVDAARCWSAAIRSFRFPGEPLPATRDLCNAY